MQCNAFRVYSDVNPAELNGTHFHVYYMYSSMQILSSDKIRKAHTTIFQDILAAAERAKMAVNKPGQSAKELKV